VQNLSQLRLKSMLAEMIIVPAEVAKNTNIVMEGDRFKV
jgi:hypothetical protein